MDIDTLIKNAFESLLSDNGEEAEKLFFKAAQLGSGHAAHELGILYRTGASGIEPDIEKSVYWLTISLESGFEETIASDPKWFMKK